MTATVAAVRAVVIAIARADRGRLVALLARGTRDIAAAEDAIATAFERALSTWPDRGIPVNPTGWVLTVARNHQRDTWRAAVNRTRAPLEAAHDAHAPATDLLDDIDTGRLPDRRLELLFVCAHPAIDAGIRTPLMLQVVLGVDAARIATAFALSHAAMAKRLVRAKQRIRDAGIPFTVPDTTTMHTRLPAVLEAIYGCAAIAHGGASAADPVLAEDARDLAVATAHLLAVEPEAWALAALTTFLHARERSPATRFVPLDEQDPATWDTHAIARGDAYLIRATSPGRPGRFQLEAAIQAVHCARARTGATDWAALRTLYQALLLVAPSLGARVALAAVTGRLDGPDAGLALLDDIAEPAEHLQAWHATRAALLTQAGRDHEAESARAEARRRTADAAVERHLARHQSATATGSPGQHRR